MKRSSTRNRGKDTQQNISNDELDKTSSNSSSIKNTPPVPVRNYSYAFDPTEIDEIDANKRDGNAKPKEPMTLKKVAIRSFTATCLAALYMTLLSAGHFYCILAVILTQVNASKLHCFERFIKTYVGFLMVNGILCQHAHRRNCTGRS